MNIDQYSPQSGRFLKEDGSYVNIADVLGGTETGQTVNIEKYAPHSGRFIKEDGTVINIAENLSGESSGSSDTAPPITEKYNNQVIQCFMSADRPLKGLNLYATSKQQTYDGKQLCIPDEIEIGGLNIDTGEDTDVTNALRTGFIPVESTKKYRYSGTDDLYFYSRGFVYQSDKTVLSSFSQENAIPENGTYVRISFSLASGEDVTESDITEFVNRFMFSEGTTETPYEPYTGGIPSPNGDYPQEIQTISNFAVEVKNSMGEGATPQTLNVTIPEQGFYGIPVSSAGNYTDSSGQQWVCDEFNFVNKKFIKRTGRISLDGSEDEKWIRNTVAENKTRFYTEISDASTKSGAKCWCNRLMYGTSGESGHCFTSNSRFYIDVDVSLNTVELLRTYLSTHTLDVIYQLEAPAEYDLSDEQVKQFQQLRSYYGTTYIDNNAVPACNMEAEIILDTKLYIDDKLLG